MMASSVPEKWGILKVDSTTTSFHYQASFTTESYRNVVSYCIVYTVHDSYCYMFFNSRSIDNSFVTSLWKSSNRSGRGKMWSECLYRVEYE